ncbi:FecR domain-containing protein [Gracilimonas sp.]|uniref:FecR family protein n=1 Tax=Gracilimonas sp. TaxID=1974203 RepID=UPI0032ED7A4C
MKEAPENQVLINYLLGICTPKELEYVEQWLSQSSDNVRSLEKVLEELHKSDHAHISKNRVKQEVFRKIDSGYITKPSKGKETISASPKSHLLVKTAVLATAFILAALFTLRLSNTEKSAEIPQATYLQERQLSYGQTSTFRFNDGSIITLNGGSTLRYPEQFDPAKREVYLEGEAFFDIASDKNRPFIVHVGNTTTQVLGTSFNIKAYNNDEMMQVTVVEGKVGVSGRTVYKKENITEPVILKENQWATYHHSGQLLEQGEGNVWEQIAWKDQVLIFNDKPFSDVAKMLERWYGVEIILKGEQLQNTKLKGEHKNMSLERVLESIQFILGIEYTIEERIVTIQAAD